MHLRAGRMAWSADGAFLATRSDAMAGAVWVWEAASFALSAVLQHISGVRELAWSPGGGPPQLAIVTGAAPARLDCLAFLLVPAT